MREVARGIGFAIVGQFVRSAENAVAGARDRIHERRIVANNRAWKVQLLNERDLSAVRLEIAIRDKRPRADPRTVDDEVELAIHLLDMIEERISCDRSAGIE